MELEIRRPSMGVLEQPEGYDTKCMKNGIEGPSEALSLVQAAVDVISSANWGVHRGSGPVSSS